MKYLIQAPGQPDTAGDYLDEAECRSVVRRSGLVEDMRTVRVTPIYDTSMPARQDRLLPAAAPQKAVYQDKDGELWLDPGTGEVIHLSDRLCELLAWKWPGTALSDVAAEFGPLKQLAVPAAGSQPREFQEKEAEDE